MVYLRRQVEGLGARSTASRMAAGELVIYSEKLCLISLLKSGRIIDGLALFTKNITLHFSGQVECAICHSYSTTRPGLSALLICVCSHRIISVMDATLPQKPCKTCKNRFHASCLYKASLFQIAFLFPGLDHAWVIGGLKRAIHRAVRSVGLIFCRQGPAGHRG